MSEQDFDTGLIMGSVVHDVKNSLGLITNEIAAISAKIHQQFPEESTQLHRLSLEASRINNGLVHMLGLYRASKNTLRIQVDEAMVQDLIEDVSVRFRSNLERLNIELEVDFDDPDLSWFLDSAMVEGILNNAITNSIRYTDSKIVLSAKVNGDQLEFMIMDDGDGYPEDVLSCLSEDGDIDFKNGSTGLGLHFSDKIARQHRKGDLTGYVELHNNARGKGAIFKLVLPWI